MNEIDDNKNNNEEDNEPKIDENSGILVDEHIKIFDPNSHEVLINKRGD